MVPPDHYPLSSLRETLSQHTGLPPYSFKLVHSGAVMKDDNASSAYRINTHREVDSLTVTVTAYGIRPGSIVALVGGEPLPQRGAPPPPATTTTTAPPPAPAPAPAHRPVTPNPPPPAPTQPPVSNTSYSVPVNGPEAASIMKIQSEWDSCERWYYTIRTIS